MVIPAQEFALAVVASSSDNLTIADKIKLYEEAYEQVVTHNKEQREANKPQIKTFKESL